MSKINIKNYDNKFYIEIDEGYETDELKNTVKNISERKKIKQIANRYKNYTVPNSYNEHTFNYLKIFSMVELLLSETPLENKKKLLLFRCVNKDLIYGLNNLRI